ncbi:MAG: hemolysin-like protein [Pelagibacteraceae bacterium]|nr:hemolysin-like protein [Pelagibacteraceae bacterium]|tara:strand:+ start:9830 stop:10774 length:945 start_codon:yes stop_codon:yes gene_type:complete
MCLTPPKTSITKKKNWFAKPVNSIKNLISNSYILDRRRIKKKLKSVRYKNFEVRLAKNFNDIDAAQNLRYRVFYEELKAKPTIKNILYEKDFDELDPFCDHLLVIDHNKKSKRESIVGTYRLIRRPMTQIHGKFYTEGEFNVKKILKKKGEILELGRSCVNKDYRDKPIIKLLWKAISAYMEHYKIKILFGCASFPGTNYKKFKEQLSYIYHYHLAPITIRPEAIPPNNIKLNYSKKKDLDTYKIFKSLPPLLKGYLRLGACVGNGAFIDKQFNTIDICIVLKIESLKERYLNLHKSKKKSKIIFLKKFLKKKE